MRFRSPLAAVGALLTTAACGSVAVNPSGVPVVSQHAGSAISFKVLAPLPDAQVAADYFYDLCGPEAVTMAEGLSNLPCGPGVGTPSGGQPPYHFQLGSGTGFLPMGLHLQKDGVIDGTPTSAGGPYTISVCAVDLAADQVCKDVTLAVDPASFDGSYEGSMTGTACGQATSSDEVDLVVFDVQGTSIDDAEAPGVSDPGSGTISGSGHFSLTLTVDFTFFGCSVTPGDESNQVTITGSVTPGDTQNSASGSWSASGDAISGSGTWSAVTQGQ